MLLLSEFGSYFRSEPEFWIKQVRQTRSGHSQRSKNTETVFFVGEVNKLLHIMVRKGIG